MGLRFRIWNMNERRMFFPGIESKFLFADGHSIYVNEKDGMYCRMLSTELGDKNGVEIFEGDILQSSDFPLRSIGVVKFGEFSDDWGHKNIGFYFDDARANKYDRLRPDLIYWIEAGVVVVGNIFENPEILEWQNNS